MSTPVVHASFTIERDYPVAPGRVFNAFADKATKRRWFVEGDGFEVYSYDLDFRIGGREASRFEFQGNEQIGPARMGNDTVYLDIVPNQRLVFAYSMSMSDQPFSASLTTIELEVLDGGAATRLVYTEQAAFFERSDGPEIREAGCRELLEHLAHELKAPQPVR